jgi:hypothetical protein
MDSPFTLSMIEVASNMNYVNVSPAPAFADLNN